MTFVVSINNRKLFKDKKNDSESKRMVTQYY